MSNTAFITGKFDKKTVERLLQQLDLLAFDPRKKYNLMRKAAREVRKYSAIRVREQRDLDGKAFPKRKRYRYNKKKEGGWTKSGKVFPTIGKSKEMAVYRQDEGMVVSWRRRGSFLHATIANFHQQGNTQTQKVTDAMREGAKKLKYKRPTRKMAKLLIESGYRERVPGKSRRGKPVYRRPSIKDIITGNEAKGTKPMSFHRCAWLTRMLKHGDVSKAQPHKPKAKQSWTITTPKRSFLGVTEQESRELLEMVEKEVLKHLWEL